MTNLINNLDPQVSARLKNSVEQQFVVGPLVGYLVSMGWTLDQLEFGKKEWLVPKRPSEASKREASASYEGFPVDIAIFEKPSRRRDPEALLIIIECKAPDEKTGVTQLETYMALEPHVQLGIWTNTGDPSGLALFLYRLPSGGFTKRRRPLSDIPRPGEKISAEERRVSFADLETPSQSALRKVIDDLLDHVVVADSAVTRREDQLDQLCNLLRVRILWNDDKSS